MLFQPHRYTRTRDMMDEFATCFEDAATVEMLDIYAASETPIPGIDTPALIQRIGRDNIRYAPSTEQASGSVPAQVRVTWRTKFAAGATESSGVPPPGRPVARVRCRSYGRRQ